MADYLGEFEQLVLLALARLSGNAANVYGVTVRETLIERTGRQVSFGAIYSTLRRLEQKGLVGFTWGEPEAVRGGRAKKLVGLTARGKAALRESHSAIMRLSEGVSGLKR